MTSHHPRAVGLSGLLTLVLLVACDSGSAPPKDAAPNKAAAAKTAGKAGPAKTDANTDANTETKAAVVPTPPVVAEPTPAVVAEPEPAPTTAVEPEPEPVDEPEPAPDDAGDAGDAGDGVDTPDTPEPAAAAGNGSTPISLGPDAELLKLVLAHDVVNRQPVDPATTFPVGQKVSVFIEARNESGEDIKVKVTWEDAKSGRRSPAIGVVIAPRKLHRTRSYRTMRKAGEYRCIVLGDDDRELAVLPFTIE